MTMDLNQLKQAVFEKGRAYGFSEMEIYYQADRATSVRIFKGDIDTFNIVERAGLSFRGEYQGTMGVAYTEKLDEASIDQMLQAARENAEVTQSEEKAELFAGSESYREARSFSDELHNTDAATLIQAALDMEAAGLAADPRIELLNSCSVVNSNSEVMIVNTKGLDCRTASTMAVCQVSALAKEADAVATAYDNAFSAASLADLDVQAFGDRVGRDAAAKLGAQEIESDNYEIIFRNNAIATLLHTYSSIFSGSNADKGLSVLQGRLGEAVAGSNITMIDDAHLPGAPGNTPFDSEGVATGRTEVIKDGQLVSFLHNLKSAKKAGVASTGNAYKAGYRGDLTTLPNNLFIMPGSQSLDELIASTKRGIMIIELHGLHSGTDAISGDFSLAALGHYIEDGKIVRPVNQITVAGNFMKMLQNVEAIGRDLRFQGTGRGACGAPSLKIKSLTISGK
ncbi:PmbA protein [Tumebacillus sp. BK434]|uniref:TldD/PmbA family protein n=1 Tax=Tumebacillus sp. BK434 TaxID=2512169 RepID=UPI0010D092D3|nr:TldD/PmbA family protein [Tumebacillus sp. BK434]TCP59467.1 PmbA protein [Tumebacillus sp. BK434]